MWVIDFTKVKEPNITCPTNLVAIRPQDMSELMLLEPLPAAVHAEPVTLVLCVTPRKFIEVVCAVPERQWQEPWLTSAIRLSDAWLLGINDVMIRHEHGDSMEMLRALQNPTLYAIGLSFEQLRTACATP